jgi:DNA polymerase-1
MKTLYLIDGYAQFFRAYHAIRTPMTSPVTKEPTNMTFGFVGMLLKLLRGEGAMGGAPDFVAVALDVSGDRGTFRSQLYEAYKAQRPPPPLDLKPQVERCLSLLQAVGVPVLGAEGFEADDVIATIATAWSEQHPDVRVRIISKDKDLKQLLGSGSPPTEMYDVHTDQLITAETLKEDLGITPAQVIDMLTLMGDTVDNVPGVEGIGPKTAAQLIVEFGSVDAVLAEVQEDKPAKEWKIKGKRRENILAAIPHLALSRELVSLRHDTPVSLDLARAAADRIDLAALLPILRELGFNRYQDEVRLMLGQSDGGVVTPMAEPVSTGSAAPRQDKSARIVGGLFDAMEEATPRARADGQYVCVTSREQLDEVVRAMREADLVAIDTETTGLRPMWASLCGLSVSVRAGSGWYIPVRGPQGETHLSESEVLDVLRPVLEDESIAKVGHNIKYDLIVLRRAGVRVRGHRPTQARPNAGDTMVTSALIDASRSSHGMDALAQALLGRQNISIKDLLGVGKQQRTFDQVPLSLASEYAAEDADVTLQLAGVMLPQIASLGLDALYRDVEMPLVDVLAELEWNGVLIDPSELERQRGRLEARLVDLRREIASAAEETVGRGFDPDSPKQLASVLFNSPDAAEPGLGLPAGRKTKTGYSTDAEVLENLVADPAVTSELPTLILEYRQLSKLVNTYLVNLREEIHPQTKRIHASFHQAGAATGRLSSSDPNLQNIPIRSDLGREIRRAFVAPAGSVLITADYSQIELRLLAHLSRDPGLIAAFEAGEDIHRAVAAQVHGVALADVTREQRSGAKMVNFGIVYGITAFGLARRLKISNAEAATIIDDYKRRFAGITTFLEECVEQARRHGYVETMLGRRRPIIDIESSNPNRRALAERVAINSVVQGSAADLIKLAMIEGSRRIASATSGDALEGVRMLIQIHDELVFECPRQQADRAKAEIVACMEGAMSLSVPIVAEASISENWYDGK